MPIKDPTIYPPYWRQFSEYIRFDRAGGKCEKCEAQNGHWKIVFVFGDQEYVEYASEINPNYLGAIAKSSKIILTVAHLDYEGGPCRCQTENRPEMFSPRPCSSSLPGLPSSSRFA